MDAVPESERFLELFVLSHIDSDHIGGALPFFNAVKRGLRFGGVWYNGWRHISGQLGAMQGEMFSSAILDFELPWNMWRAGASILTDGDILLEHVLPGGMRLTLLSPARERLTKLAPIWTREPEVRRRPQGTVVQLQQQVQPGMERPGARVCTPALQLHHDRTTTYPSSEPQGTSCGCCRSPPPMQRSPATRGGVRCDS